MGLLDDVTQQAYYQGSDLGNYQFISLDDIINNFIFAYTGEDNLIPKVKTSTIAFHAQRAIQELSYDTFKSIKSQEIVVPSSLTMILPQDYVNYVKIAWSDASGVEHVLYPVSKTSNPTDITQDANGDYTFTNNVLDTDTSSTTWENYKDNTPTENQDSFDDDYYVSALGQRYGLEPAHAQTNGSFFIDETAGKFHFSSNLSGKTLILKYISDGLVTNAANTALDLDATKIHKFAEEAIYKYMAYGLLSTRNDSNPNMIQMLKKERFAETRKAKLRLSNIKIEELAQIMRGKSKVIKH